MAFGPSPSNMRESTAIIEENDIQERSRNNVGILSRNNSSSFEYERRESASSIFSLDMANGASTLLFIRNNHNEGHKSQEEDEDGRFSVREMKKVRIDEY